MSPIKQRLTTWASLVLASCVRQRLGFPIYPKTVACSRFIRGGGAATNNVENKTTVTKAIEDIVQKTISWQQASSKKEESSTPFVTLAYAQSLDGMIAVSDPNTGLSSNFPLSDSESMRLTHALRSIHDAILIGGQTLATDNPRLTNRLWGARIQHQPRAIVLDTHLRHIQTLGEKLRADNIIVCCSYGSAADYQHDTPKSIELLPCRCRGDGNLDVHDTLRQLYEKFGIRSIMVEGGGSVLTSFVCAKLVDCVCVTIAPLVLGAERGLPAFSRVLEPHNYTTTNHHHVDLRFAESAFLQLRSDCVFLGRCQH